MRRQRPYSLYETSPLRPKWKRVSFIKREIPPTNDRDAVFLIVATAAFLVLLCGLLVVRSRRKTNALPNVPWVGRDRHKWFSKLRARTWTTVNYETALKEAYDKVSLLVSLQHEKGTDRDSVFEE